jgi:hypothetical protein
MARILPEGRKLAIPDEVALALATLQESFGKPLDTIPPGWRTSEQWSIAWNMPRRRTSELLRAGLLSGKVDTKDFIVVCGPSKRPVRHYFIRVK